MMVFSRLQLMAIAVTAAAFFTTPAQEAAAQVANVIVSATRDGATASVQVAVSANFQGASGSHVIRATVSEGQTQSQKETKDGFVYTVNVTWPAGTDTIEAKANVRSKYGQVDAVGRTKL